MAKLNNISQTIQARLDRALPGLMPVLGNRAVVFFKDSFRQQAWIDNSTQPWKPRRANTKRNKGRGILIDSGRLSRSPRMINISGLTVRLGTDVPYAKAHNDGFRGVVTVKSYKRNKFGKVKVSTGKSGQPFREKKGVVGIGTVKQHQRSMNLPRRRFMGNSATLRVILARHGNAYLIRKLKP